MGLTVFFVLFVIVDCELQTGVGLRLFTGWQTVPR